MIERIITDSNGRKHITTEPLLHPTGKQDLQVENEQLKAEIERLNAMVEKIADVNLRINTERAQLHAEVERLHNEVKAMECDDVSELRKEIERLKQEQAEAEETISILNGELCMFYKPRQEQAEPKKCISKNQTGLRPDMVCDNSMCGFLGQCAIKVAPKQEQAEPLGYVSRHTTKGCEWQFNRELNHVYRDTAISIDAVYAAPQGQTALLKQALEAMSDIRYVSDYTHIVALCESIKQHLGEALE